MIPLPCGKCPGCVSKRVSGWSIRLMKEEERCSSSYFVTLTYDTTHAPMVRNGMSLCKEDLQLFFKRLRKYQRKIERRRLIEEFTPIMTKQQLKQLLKNYKYGKITYYAVGEYGSKSMRPHYHLILFNTDVEAVIQAWKKDGKEIGTSHFGTVTEASIGYSLKYISKPSRVPQFPGDQRQPEFALMSKRIGDNYINENNHRWHKSALHERCYIPLPGNKKAPIPRYYKEKIYSKEQLGWLKGIMEAISFDNDIENHRYKDYDKRKVEADKAAFKKMYQSSTKNTSI